MCCFPSSDERRSSPTDNHLKCFCAFRVMMMDMMGNMTNRVMRPMMMVTAISPKGKYILFYYLGCYNSHFCTVVFCKSEAEFNIQYSIIQHLQYLGKVSERLKVFRVGFSVTSGYWAPHFVNFMLFASLRLSILRKKDFQ